MAEYLSPSIGQVMPQLDRDCADLIRQTLVRALTDYTKQLCEYDPELADILLEGKKTLPRCICYVTEQAQKIAAKQAEAMTAKEVDELSKTKIHGRDASVMGLAVSDEEVYEWAKAYYYGGAQVEPFDATAGASNRKTPTAKSKAKSEKKTGGTGSDEKQGASAEKKGSAEAKPSQAETAQLSLFGNAA